MILGQNLISWIAKKLATKARFSTESEHHAIAKLIWFKSLLHELVVTLSTRSKLWQDNIGVIYLTSNPVFHAQTKHIELDYHFL